METIKKCPCCKSSVRIRAELKEEKIVFGKITKLHNKTKDKKQKILEEYMR